MNLKKLKLYTFSELIQVLKYSIGYRLLKDVPQGIKIVHGLIGRLEQEEVILKKNKKSIFFKYIINKSPFRIYLEKDSSDPIVFIQILIQKEYDAVLKIINHYGILCNIMIDAGANIGLTSIYFKSIFPQIKIIALEPSSSTFKRLERNIRGNQMDNVQIIMKGLWSHKTQLAADHTFRDGKDWAFRLVEASENEKNSFEVLSITDIINQNDLTYIDFLKIDIEGGEVNVFSKESNLDWLNKVRLLAIEIHDEFDCRSHIENTLLKFGFELSHSGELTIGVNKNLL